MNELLQSLWQLNIEISLLLLVILSSRYAIRKSTKVYNSYLLWLSIPVGLLVARLVAQIRFSEPPVETVTYIVQSYIVQPSETFDPWVLVGYVWAAVALLLVLRLVKQHKDLRSDLSDIMVPNRIDLQSRFPIVAIDKKDFSPAVYGFLSPKIYFPVQLSEELSSEQIQLIIQHEEHHIRQKHLWLNLLWDVLVCVMWFNPLVYVSRQNFRHDQELFCDYLVLHKSNQHKHKSYGYALLTTVSATHSVSLLCSWKTFDRLEERIMNIKRPTSFGSKLSLAVASAIIIGGTSLYTVSAGEYSSKESFRHPHADAGDKQTNWQKGHKTHVEKNGRRYVFNEAQERLMTRQEELELEQAIEASQRELAEHQEFLAISEFDRENNRAEIERAHQAAVAETAHILPVSHQAERVWVSEIAELEKSDAMHERVQAMVELERRDVKRELAREVANQHRAQILAQRKVSRYALGSGSDQEEIIKAQHEIERARIEIEKSFQSGKLSEEARRNAVENLAEAEKRVARYQEKLIVASPVIETPRSVISPVAPRAPMHDPAKPECSGSNEKKS